LLRLLTKHIYYCAALVSYVRNEFVKSAPDQRGADEERGAAEQAGRPGVRGDQGQDEERKAGEHARGNAGKGKRAD
jgi:hypothetical protein